jgi:hypothetical protein
MFKFVSRTVTFIMLGLLLWVSPASRAAAQQPPLKDQLVGTWTLVLVDNVQSDGSRIQLYGPNPQGILFFDGAGHYALEILRSGRPRFAANDKSKGTPEEYQAAVQGTNSHFGTYAVESDPSPFPATNSSIRSPLPRPVEQPQARYAGSAFAELGPHRRFESD